MSKSSGKSTTQVVKRVRQFLGQLDGGTGKISLSKMFGAPAESDDHK